MLNDAGDISKSKIISFQNASLLILQTKVPKRDMLFLLKEKMVI